ncbi:MAG: winged helix-turn-helix domain-containing protein [Candidatus Thermoplasmatota archaeon]
MHAVKRLLWWLLAGSVGGINRGRLLEELFKTPHNAHELAKLLNLDYKTVRHHLDILEKNKILTSTGREYGKVYFPSDLMEEHHCFFTEIWDQIGKKKITKEKNEDEHP